MRKLELNDLLRIQKRAKQVEWDKKMAGGVEDVRLLAEDVISLVDEILAARAAQQPRH